MTQHHLPSFVLVLALVGMCCGCVSGFSPRETPCPVYDEFPKDKQILAIGDSVFAWRMDTCKTVPDVAATTLGRRLRHKAVNGARLTGGEHAIVNQYEPGDWDWVIVDGGGNDLNNECQCGVNCDAVLDRLVSADGKTGELPELLDEIRADGARVALYGYFRIDDRAYYDFDECRGELDILHTRQEKAAAHRAGVYFVDTRTVISPESTPNAYAFDHVHPSSNGAHRAGKLIAKTILAAEASSTPAKDATE